jgi:hypothetical protein
MTAILRILPVLSRQKFLILPEFVVVLKMPHLIAKTGLFEEKTYHPRKKG